MAEEQYTEIKDTLDKYLAPNGHLDVSEIEDDWFPEINA